MDTDKSKIDMPQQNMISCGVNESDNVEQEISMRLDGVVKEVGQNLQESALSECDQEVFVCENDLGVGVDKQNTMTQQRRQTLLKMISDPSVHNRQFFKSLCFCHDLNREMLIYPGHISENHSKAIPKNPRGTFSMSE